ncbi:hypothetical protein MATR_23020 [Marivirga tractuosa]|uniref:hypothetical protein n=1 Tax=Marivirga tractuosa TaxID=1006 RepID=UPI0005A2060D|nr:hypothetical protein [Marivirga tractuosa]BDD15477.1 hypothetical protein MATR_23020 [Marivirga tractuosa]
METLIYILKAHLLFLILGGIYHFTLRTEKSFTFNRFYLLAIYGVSIVAPLLDFKIFNNIKFLEPSLLDTATYSAGMSNSANTAANNLVTFEVIFPWIYGFLVSLSLLFF